MSALWRMICASLFLKLLLVLVTAALIANLAVVIGLRHAIVHEAPDKGAFGRNVEAYFGYLERDIGLPVDAARLRELAVTIGLEIVVEHDGKTWRSAPSLPAYGELIGTQRDLTRLGPFRQRERFGFVTGSWEERLYILHDTGAARYVFWSPRDAPLDLSEEIVVVMLACLSASIALAWLAIRHMLTPVRSLAAGVGRIASGILDQPVPVRGKDELGKLASAFNDMGAQIRSMLRDKEQLLLDVSHELRSPLTRLRLAVELLDDESAAAALRGDLDEMERMTATLLDAARQTQSSEPTRREVHDLASLVREVAAPLAGTPPGVTLMLPALGAPARLDVDKARSAIRNVLDNALKYSLEASAPVQVTLELRENTVALTIADDGVGIPEGELARVFEPFYRVDRSRSKKTGGFGLGLHLAERLMHAQGGSITLQRRSPRGVIVRLEFERAPV